MNRTPVKTVGIQPGAVAPSLNKAQQLFNQRIGQIEQRRRILALWQDSELDITQKIVGKLQPLLETGLDLRVRLLFQLDRAHARKGLSQSERRRLSELICDLSAAILGQRPDPELQFLYQRHSGADFPPLAAAEEDGRARDAWGEADGRERRRAAGGAEARKKSARQLEREQRQHSDREAIGRSLQGVYRKLASILHPDREPDAEARARKTTLMQRANDAYASRNLLQLLELQLELEHIDQTELDHLSAERLKHYNVILKQQLARLDQEIRQIEQALRAQLGLAADCEISVQFIAHHLSTAIGRARQDNRDMERELLVLEDIWQLKAWLAELRRQDRQPVG